jgi:hypothetical protein
MKVIIDEDGEIIAKATDDHTLIGGHHRLSVAASLGKRLFWRDTGEPVKLDLFFKHHGSSLRYSAWAARRAYHFGKPPDVKATETVHARDGWATRIMQRRMPSLPTMPWAGQRAMIGVCWHPRVMRGELDKLPPHYAVPDRTGHELVC